MSTCTEITATRFTNKYHWGSFRGDPEKMMASYFDAFLYLANWGTRHLMFRVPRIALDARRAEEERRAAAKAAAYGKRLDQLASRAEAAWKETADLIETKKPRDYDLAVTRTITVTSPVGEEVPSSMAIDPAARAAYVEGQRR